MTRARDNADFGHLAGRRNLIINGDFRINQRGGTRTPGTNIYGYDRWKGHANGVYQIVEQENFEDGEYTLSWEGGGDGWLDSGALVPTPITKTIVADHNVGVVVPADATNVQLERGNKATPFERRLIGEELALCQRYYEKSYSFGTAPGAVNDYSGAIYHGPLTAASAHYVTVRYVTRKRATPTITVWNPSTGGSGSAYFSNGSNIGPSSVFGSGHMGANPRFDVGASGLSIFMHYSADAEL